MRPKDSRDQGPPYKSKTLQVMTVGVQRLVLIVQRDEVPDVIDDEKTDHSLPQTGDDAPVDGLARVKNEVPSEDDTDD